MGYMAMEFFRQSPVLALPVLALVIFMLVFFTVALRAILTNEACWNDIARLPLERDAAHGEESHHE